ncbi:hypothetical protein QQ045_019316 [Rhodiola kirilowii]
MDDFGVLTQSMGIKPQGKAAPMAALKQSSRPVSYQPHSKIPSFSNSDVFDDVFGPAGFGKSSNRSGANSASGSFYDAGDVFGEMPGFRSSGSPDSDDVFGVNQTAPVDDLFGGLGATTVTGSAVFRNGSGGSAKASPAGFDNLIPGFGGSTAKSNGINLNTSVSQQAKKSTVNRSEDPFILLESTSGNMSPDLLDQLGHLGTSRSTNLHHSSSSGSLYDNTDPFDIFNNADVRSSSSREANKAYSTRPASLSPPSRSPPPRPTKKAESVKNPIASSIDELEDFAMGRMQQTATKKSDVPNKKDGSNSAAAAFTATWKEKQGSHVTGSTGFPHISRQKSEDADFLFGLGSHSRINKNRVADDAAAQGNHHKSADDLESFFGTSRSNSAPRARTTNLNTAFDNLFHNGVKHEQAPKVNSRTPSSRKKASPHTNLVDDFSSLFGPGLSGDFQDIDGEPEERRKARLGRHCRVQDRVAQAVADMNERDLQSQREQEEKQRIADSLDADIKRWAAGKEGNLRALLSSMQYVLWVDCGWEPVSLTDLITSTSVKKVYRKATLFVHPDKVQQKGANLQQKYVAEKVFDILKVDIQNPIIIFFFVRKQKIFWLR